MAKEMTQAKLVEHFATKFAAPKKLVGEFFAELATVAYKEAKNGFKIPGLGKLVVVNRKARKGRNPKTGEVIKIPAKKVIKFRVSKAAKDAVIGTKKK